MIFGKRKKPAPREYDKEQWRPVLKCSICNGEQVAGFQNIHTGAFREEMLIRNGEDLASFRARYGITTMEKIY